MEKNTDKIQLLTWKVNEQLYAADIKYCHEVQTGKVVIDVPHAKEYVAGIVNLRGDVVTVIDLFTLMGQESQNKSDKFVLIRLKLNDKQIAVKADNISDVIELPTDKLEPANMHLSENELKYIPYIAYSSGGLIMILNVEELFIVK
jgi:purine-binding chemotaxis protein CheW